MTLNKNWYLHHCPILSLQPPVEVVGGVSDWEESHGMGVTWHGSGNDPDRS